MHSQRDFFATVLPTEGKPCIARLVKNKDRAFFKHDVFDTIADMTKALDTIDFSEFNYYFCISTLREASVEERGKTRTRVQSNTLNTRCFVLDVDIRPEKQGHYATVEDALEGVRTVAQSFSLPDPIIVNSGFGLHVYWPMADGIESARWRKIAAKFKSAIQVIAPEVVADGSRVADSAGVLRIPNSFNLKGGKLTPVEIIQWYSDFVDVGELETLLNRIAGIPENGPVVKTNIGATVTESQPGQLTNIAKNCAWVGNYIKHRDTAGEPEWYAMLGLVPYMIYTKGDKEVSGPDLAHLISKGHKDYDGEATYKKYIQAKNNQTGPTTCARLQAIDPEHCKGCPFAVTVKTPIQTSFLSKPATKETVKHTISQDDEGIQKEETVTIPLPPKPYFRGEDGGVFVRIKKQQEDGSWDEVIQKIYDYDLYPVRRYRTESLENELMEVHLWLPRDGLRKFKMPNGLLADGKAMAKFMSDKGVVTEYAKGAPLVKFLVDYVRHLQLTQAAEVEFSRFGWRELHSTEPKFVVGDGFLNKKGELLPSTHADFLKQSSKAVSVKGNLDKWKQGFGVYKGIPDSEPYILAAMLGFAAPLMAFTEYSGVLYNMNGHSGSGKSTALKVMTSVFGEPNATHITKVDTEISTFNLIGYLNNIPVAYDELTNLEGQRLSDFCLNFTLGRGKMRASRDGQNKTNEVQWDTIVCSTTNTSLYDKLADVRKGYNAEAMRVFELPVMQSHTQYKHHIDTHTRILLDNYGIAGREYVKFLLPRVEKVKELVHKAMVSVTEKGNLRNEERFWGALLACVLVGGKISRDILKLHDYDVEGLVDWALGSSDDVREHVASTTADPISHLAEFMNSNLNAILRIEDGRPSLSGMQGNMNAIRGRIEYQGGKPAIAYLSIPALSEYCKHRNIDRAWMRKELIDAAVITNGSVQKRLTAGSNLPSVNVKCWQIDLTNPKLLDVVDTEIKEPSTATE